MTEQPKPKPGQIWVDMDPREERYVEVMAVYEADGVADIRRVSADGSIWPKARRVPTVLRRFNGKSRGYAIHKDV